MARYVLDPGARRLDGGLVLLAGSPLRLFRLTRAGAALVDRVEQGEELPTTKAAARLVDRLLDAGAIHPCPVSQAAGFAMDDVTVVIPSYGDDVGALVERLGRPLRIVVVDDGSTPPLAAAPPAHLVRRAHNGGPGLARNTGLASVRTPLVAFLDADSEPAPSWLQPLLAHFDDPQVGLAAPRITGGSTERRPASVRDRYEAARSPLDLGGLPARIRARTRVSYVPAAALVCRVEAIRELDGFDPSLRVGEDVDLVWRLDEAGWRCRYEPSATVHHRPRRTWAAWARQRFAYGRSAAGLAQRHRGALAPIAVSGWSAGAWALALSGAPLGALTVVAATSAALARKLKQLHHPLPMALRLAGVGTLLAGRQLATATTRAWWPIALVGTVASRRVRRAVALAVVVPALLDWWDERPAIDPVRYALIHLADDVAYGAGLWAGAIDERIAAPLLPDWTSWPRPGRYERETAAAARPAGGRATWWGPGRTPWRGARRSLAR